MPASGLLSRHWSRLIADQQRLATRSMQMVTVDGIGCAGSLAEPGAGVECRSTSSSFGSRGSRSPPRAVPPTTARSSPTRKSQMVVQARCLYHQLDPSSCRDGGIGFQPVPISGAAAVIRFGARSRCRRSRGRARPRRSRATRRKEWRSTSCARSLARPQAFSLRRPAPRRERPRARRAARTADALDRGAPRADRRARAADAGRAAPSAGAPTAASVVADV